MAMNFGEMSGIKQWATVLVGGALVTAALYYTMFKNQDESNATAQHALEEKIRENNELESYRPKLKQMEQQLAELKQQLEIEQRIVPDEKQAWSCGALRLRTPRRCSTTPKFPSIWNLMGRTIRL
jgi:Tfp pilus assembly protein PilO